MSQQDHLYQQPAFAAPAVRALKGLVGLRWVEWILRRIEGLQLVTRAVGASSLVVTGTEVI